MKDIRRSVIMLSDFCALILIGVFTLIGAITGYSTGSVVAAIVKNEIVVFIFISLGATVGFVVSALPAALLFTLSEISENTRRSTEMLDAVLRFTAKDAYSSNKTSNGNSRTRGLVHLKDGKVLTQESLDILKRAKEAGYRLKMHDDGAIILEKEGTAGGICNSNFDIFQFGQRLDERGP